MSLGKLSLGLGLSQRGVSMQPETLAWIAKMSAAPSAAYIAWYDAFIVATKPLFSKMIGLYLLAAHDEQAGRVNIVNPTDATIGLADKYGTPTHVAGVSMASASNSDFIRTNIYPKDLAQEVKDTLGIGVYCNTMTADIGAAMGVRSGGYVAIYPNFLDAGGNNTCYGGIFASGINSNSYVHARQVGLKSAQRTSNSTTRYLINNLEQSNQSRDFLDITNSLPIMILGRALSATTASEYYSSPLALAYISGENLTNAEHTAWAAFLTTWLAMSPGVGA